MAPRRPQVLLLVHRVPYPPDKGDRIRSHRILHYLAERADVHLAALADEPVPDSTRAELGRLTVRHVVAEVGGPRRWLRGFRSFLGGGTLTDGLFAAPFLRRTVAQWLQEIPFDVIFVFSSSTAQYARGWGPVVCDLVDVDSEKWLQYAAAARWPLSWLFRVEGRRLRRCEIELGTTAQAVLLVTEPEAALYRSFGPPAAVRVVPNGVDLHFFQPAVGGQEFGLVFVGAMDYRPNVQGMTWFCDAVWPELRRRQPQLTLTIVGRNPTAAVQRLAEHAGVTVVGAVPDVRPYLQRAAVVVAPLHIARGIQNKLLEALAMGKAVVTTPQAAQGLGLRHGAHALIARQPEEWVTAVSALTGDATQRYTLGRAGRAFVQSQYDWAACFTALDDVLDPILGRAPSLRDSPAAAPAVGPVLFTRE